MTTGKIEKLPTSAPFGCQGDWREKINELVDAVNELMDDKHPTSTPQAKQDLEIAQKALKEVRGIRCLPAQTPWEIIAEKALKQIEHKE